MGQKKVHLENLAALSAALTRWIDWVLTKHPRQKLSPGAVVVAIQPRGNRRRGTLGWFAPHRWGHAVRGYEDLHEISLVAEELTRLGPAGAAAATLHELVHLLSFLADVRDTSRGGAYHNKNFQLEAERLGLVVSHDEKHGWSDTRLGPDLAAELEATGFLPKPLFKLQRVERESKSKPTHRTWACECRGATGRPQTVLAWRELQLRARCLECGRNFSPLERNDRS